MHESGHMLGLLHPCELGGALGAPDCSQHPEAAEATMYPVYSSGEVTLSADDVAGVCFLYPGSDCEITGCPSGTVCQPEGCLVKCGERMCMAGERCTSDGCQPAPPPGECSGPLCTKPGCIRDDECATVQQCVHGKCQGRVLNGDPCKVNEECAGGACDGGFCTFACSSDLACPPGLTCSSKVANAPGQCIGKLPLGATCTSPDQCLGGECLAGAGDTAICTRRCGGTSGSCPADWLCSSVDGNAVCRPFQVAAGGGCSLGAREGKGPGRAGAGALATLALVGVVRRRRAFVNRRGAAPDGQSTRRLFSSSSSFGVCGRRPTRHHRRGGTTTRVMRCS